MRAVISVAAALAAFNLVIAIPRLPTVIAAAAALLTKCTKKLAPVTNDKEIAAEVTASKLFLTKSKLLANSLAPDVNVPDISS